MIKESPKTQPPGKAPDMAPIPAPAPEPNPQYARWTREFALILIRDGHTPADVSFADDSGYIGGVFAELAAGRASAPARPG